jgi:hypothetical protein
MCPFENRVAGSDASVSHSVFSIVSCKVMCALCPSPNIKACRSRGCKAVDPVLTALVIGVGPMWTSLRRKESVRAGSRLPSALSDAGHVIDLAVEHSGWVRQHAAVRGLSQTGCVEKHTTAQREFHFCCRHGLGLWAGRLSHFLGDCSSIPAEGKDYKLCCHVHTGSAVLWLHLLKC